MEVSRKIFTWKGVVLVMGLLAMLGGLFGCTKGTGEPEENENIHETATPKGTGDKEDDGGESVNHLSKKVVTCDFGVSGYMPGFSIVIEKDEDDDSKTVLRYENRDTGYIDITCEVDSDTMDRLNRLFGELNIISWDKFKKSDDYVLDGSGFYLYATFDDGTAMSAQGSNCFPENYGKFESGMLEVIAPLVEAERARINDEKYQNGDYSKRPEEVMINFSGRGKSGSDKYSFLLRDGETSYNSAEMTVNSVSGEFIKSGDYSFAGNPDISGLMDEIQKILEKYKVYKWDGYDKSTADYSDREWFQIFIGYENASIDACGCGDTENYAKVREELLELLIKYMQEYKKTGA